MTAFELAVQDLAGVRVAETVRPDRMELCTALVTGGLTPSAGLVERAVASGVPVHVLIRPRAGGFAYDDAERALILRDAAVALDRGAAGIVVGGTVPGPAGEVVDADLVARALETAGDREVTFHRAFDTLGDRAGAIELLARLGVTRILTSGGAPRAADALHELSALAARAADRIQIMAGSGVNARNAASIAATGVHAVHGSAGRHVSGDAMWGGYDTNDEAEARAIMAAIGRGASATSGEL